MPYLIDGHNLIPRLPGMNLADLDDEMRLVDMLQEFCRRQRKQAEVFFDNAPPGGTRLRNFGLVIARFVRQGRTADQAIHERLERLGRTARNWTVVSSDKAVQASARARQAQFLSSEIFAGMLLEALDTTRRDPGDQDSVSMSADELDDWMNLFGADENNPG
ncbi:MAG: NYN domain-containing protein [Chloroflexota bacterium]